MSESATHASSDDVVDQRVGEPQIVQTMTTGHARFRGWLAKPGPPFAGEVMVPHTGRSLILIGANGFGKTRLLEAIVSRRTPRVFESLPPVLLPYLALGRAQTQDNGVASGQLDLVDLFEDAEATRALGDEQAWWSNHLAVPKLRWIVRWHGDDAPASLAAVSAVDLSSVLIEIPAAPRHVEKTIQRWVIPDAESPAELPTRTESAFRAWAGAVLTTTRSGYVVYANPLIAGDAAGRSISLLALGAAFADALAERTSARLRRLVGFSLDLRCVPEDRFAWSVNLDGDWIPLEWTSRAMNRWSALAAQETLQELLNYVDGAVASDVTSDSQSVLKGELDGLLVPPGEPSPFASKQSWVALDEPEVHLFTSEAHRLGDALARHGRAGRTVVATHSLDLAARFVGNADFLMFDGPGRFTVDRPSDGVATLLGRLAKSGPGILAWTQVLYVEGDWDVEIIERLYGDLLSEKNVLMSKMHGVRGANLAASSVWQRMMSMPFGMMFDSLHAADVDRKWRVLRSKIDTGRRGQALSDLRRAIKAAGRGAEEDIGLLRLFSAVLEGRLEDRLRLVMHGLSDIFQVCHPSLFGLAGNSWTETGYNEGSFKRFVRAETSINLADGGACREIINAFDREGHPVDTASERMLHDAIARFVEGNTPASL